MSDASDTVRATVRWMLAVFFVVAGANHFRSPAIYLGMMPPWLPWPEAMNALSGAAEIMGGAGLVWPSAWAWPATWLRPRTEASAATPGEVRRWAGWGLIALLVAIFPANLHVALEGKMAGTNFSPTVLWARLPFQAVFIAAVWWVALARPRRA